MSIHKLNPHFYKISDFFPKWKVPTKMLAFYYRKAQYYYREMADVALNKIGQTNIPARKNDLRRKRNAFYTMSRRCSRIIRELEKRHGPSKRPQMYYWKVLEPGAFASLKDVKHKMGKLNHSYQYKYI